MVAGVRLKMFGAAMTRLRGDVVPRVIRLLARRLLAVSALLVVVAFPASAEWATDFGYPGPDRDVTCAVEVQGELVVGGGFQHVDGVASSGVARWDGSRWTVLGPTTNVGAVYSLAAWRGELYGSGYFRDVSGDRFYLGRWDGTEWVPVPGLSGRPLQLLVWRDRLVATGYLSGAGSRGAVGIFDGESWSFRGDGAEAFEFTATVAGEDLFVFGEFDSLDGVVAPGAARLTDEGWEPLRARPSDQAWTATAWGGDPLVIVQRPDSLLYRVYRIERYHDDKFEPLGPEWLEPPGLIDMDGTLTALGVPASSNDGASIFSTWTGQGWVPILGGSPGTLSCCSTPKLARFGDSVVALGGVRGIGGSGAIGLALWDGAHWNAAGTTLGVWGSVSDLAPGGDAIAVTGDLRAVGTTPCGPLALWSHSGWTTTPPAPGFVGTDVALFEGQWVVGGTTDPLGDSLVVRTLEPTGWRDLGSLVGSLYQLAVVDGRLCAGGYLATSPGSAVYPVLRWTGGEWTPLDPRLTGNAWSVFGSPRGLFVSGTLSVDGQACTLARVSTDGIKIAAESTSFGDLLALSSGVVACGSFTSIGGVYSPGIAMWDDDGWHSFAQGRPGEPRPVTIDQLASDGTAIYAYGNFLERRVERDGVIARWNGESWTLLSGEIYSVDDLEVWDGSLYVCGNFEDIGEIPSAHFARFDRLPASELAPPGLRLVDAGPNPFSSETRVLLDLTAPSMVEYDLFDVLGRKVDSARLDVPTSGFFQLRVPRASGRELPIGSYFLRLRAGGRSATRRLVVVR